jgi:hypothetical protein
MLDDLREALCIPFSAQNALHNLVRGVLAPNVTEDIKCILLADFTKCNSRTTARNMLHITFVVGNKALVAIRAFVQEGVHGVLENWDFPVMYRYVLPAFFAVQISNIHTRWTC